MADQRALRDLVKHQAVDSKETALVRRSRTRLVAILGLIVLLTWATEILTNHFSARPDNAATQSHSLLPR